MILEVAVLMVKNGNQYQFEKDFLKASAYISSISGYISHQLKKCMEIPNKYLLTVEWETLEAHTITFRESLAYQEWKKLLHHHSEPFPVVEHFESINI
jgi:heme-degrading monooxygenase HmoA